MICTGHPLDRSNKGPLSFKLALVQQVLKNVFLFFYNSVVKLILLLFHCKAEYKKQED